MRVQERMGGIYSFSSGGAVYRVSRRIGRGGMAEVYLGLQEGIGGLERLVVIKRIYPHFGEDEHFTRMLLEEARLAASIRHPNVVQILDIGRDDDGYFIVMEYLSGETLVYITRSLRAREESVPPAIACRFAAEVAAGLHCAHTATDAAGNPVPIIHRDVTPSNLILCFNGVVKIVDFGVAKANLHEGHTRGGIKGKMSYLAPEQLYDQPVDGRTDVFQLGICLHELLTGQRLFKGDSDQQRAVAVLEREIQPPSAVVPSLPKVLDEVVMWALERDPDQRPASADDFRRALEAAATEIGAVSGHDLGGWMKTTFADRLAERTQFERQCVAEMREGRTQSGESFGLLPRETGSLPGGRSLTGSGKSLTGSGRAITSSGGALPGGRSVTGGPSGRSTLGGGVSMLPDGRTTLTGSGSLPGGRTGTGRLAFPLPPLPEASSQEGMPVVQRLPIRPRATLSQPPGSDDSLPDYHDPHDPHGNSRAPAPPSAGPPWRLIGLVGLLVLPAVGMALAWKLRNPPGGNTPTQSARLAESPPVVAAPAPPPPREPAAPPSPAAAQPEPARTAAATSFEVAVTVVPAAAAIVLDGVEVGRGTYHVTLPRDGARHTMSFQAEGYESVGLDFTDQPPPARVQLDPVRLAAERRPAPRPARRAQASIPSVKRTTKPRPSELDVDDFLLTDNPDPWAEEAGISDIERQPEGSE